jgi:hypothetical protein
MLSAEGEGYAVSVGGEFVRTMNKAAGWRSRLVGAGRVGYRCFTQSRGARCEEGYILQTKSQAQSHAHPLADDWCCLMRGVGWLAPCA